MRSRLVWTAILIAAGLAPVQAQVPTGHLKGRVGSVATGERLAGVTVTVGGTKLGAMTDGEGVFAITAIPVGGYNVTFRCLGYQSQTVTDVMIRSDRVSYLNADLPEIAVELDTLQVVSAYFQKDPDAPLSNTRFRAEEIRRAPGSAGDISRVLTALPAAAQVADNANDLMIRGGSPAENLFLVDNIPIPNINHFPVQGATGGPIGILNVDFIEDVRVSTGGFPAGFGDRLSSVIDIRLREGNREKTETQVDMNMAGFGSAAEGPLARGKGSWMVSAKRSYLDLFVGAIGTGVAPRFGDVQGKLTYDLSPRNRLTVVDVFGASAIRFSHDQAFRTGQFLYGRYAGRQNTLGVNWRSLWSRNGYSNTSLSYAFLHSNDAWQEVRNDREYYRAENGEGTLTLRNANYYEFSRHHKLEFGLEVWRRAADYRYAVAEDTNRLGELDPALDVRTGFQSADGAIFASYLWSPVRGFTATFGARGDYASSSKKIHGSPRIAASWRVQDRLSLNAAAGLYRQRLPLYLLHQEPGNRKLDDPQARHYIVGLDWIPKPGAQLTLEAYDKEYRHLPLEPGDPSLSVIDEGRSFSGYRRYYGLRDAGVARSRGVELQMQQKLVDRFYGLLSASVSRFRYRDYEGRWRDRACDNRYQATLVAGYKPGHRWEASLRWNFAGGVPYTPFDEARSKAMNTGIIDPTRIQEARYPSYQSLNLRLDRRFFFRKSSLVTYLSVWNTFNRKNVAAYYWNEAKNEPDTLYQWSLLPVFGVEYEF